MQGLAGKRRAWRAPVGLRHAGDGDAFGAEPFDDPVIDLESAGGLHVDVDVRETRAPLGQEPLFSDR